jgi:hypothetical protein
MIKSVVPVLLKPFTTRYILLPAAAQWQSGRLHWVPILMTRKAGTADGLATGAKCSDRSWGTAERLVLDGASIAGSGTGSRKPGGPRTTIVDAEQ